MKNNTGNIYIGIAVLLIITAMVSGGVIYLRDSEKKDPVTLSSEEPKKALKPEKTSRFSFSITARYIHWTAIK